jgi:hypothetical protein
MLSSSNCGILGQLYAVIISEPGQGAGLGQGRIRMYKLRESIGNACVFPAALSHPRVLRLSPGPGQDSDHHDRVIRDQHPSHSSYH